MQYEKLVNELDELLADNYTVFLKIVSFQRIIALEPRLRIHKKFFREYSDYTSASIRGIATCMSSFSKSSMGDWGYFEKPMSIPKYFETIDAKIVAREMIVDERRLQRKAGMVLIETKQAKHGASQVLAENYIADTKKQIEILQKFIQDIGAYQTLGTPSNKTDYMKQGIVH